MKQNVVEKLEWRILLAEIVAKCRTQEAQERVERLQPNLTSAEVLERWRLVEPLRALLHQGYSPPMADLDDLRMIFRAIDIAQTLTGKELRQVYQLLLLVKNVHKFCQDFSGKCVTLKQFHSRSYPLPRIMTLIDRTVAPNGELHDDASAELARIRSAKLLIRKRIESSIRGLFQDPEVLKYIQDDFYTIRSDRYVVPIALDGRGRIKGSIYDTSDSGQTLFIEPSVIAPMNEELLELELGEKLEILRIFREIGQALKAEIQILRDNYQELVELDILTAEAQLAVTLDARPVEISDLPGIELYAARHPVLMLNRLKEGDQRRVVSCSVSLKPQQTCLVISGPNAGGKTVVLKTIGLLHMMARAGLLLPADEGSRLYLYDDIFLELGDSQNLVANLSTFSGHIMGLKPIIEQASKRALVLLDEIAAGTEPQAGAALAQAILEDLAQSGATTVVTTHFDSLKGMALGDQRFRNASMEYAADTLRPTYKLILDVPGQSFGIEMAQQIGLKDSIINRAQSLRGNQAARIDETLNVLAKLRRDLERRNDELQARVVELEASKSHWQREKDELGTARKALAAQITARYEEDLSAMRLEYEDIVDSLKKQLKLLERSTSSDQSDVKAQIQELRQKADRQLTAMNASVQNLKPKEVPAGRKVSISELKLGLQVIVSSLAKPGVIQRIGGQSDIEVRVGVMNVRVEIDDLIHADVAAKPKPSSRQVSSAAPIRSQASVPYTPKTATNSIDLRGLEADVAGEAVLRFLDQCFRRGESQIVIIHGHGSNRVKHEVRQVLADCRDYELSFRPGEEGEGGDGVTIVLLHR